MLTTLALGRTIVEAQQLLNNDDIVKAFHGALEKQAECPLAGMQALHQALEQYEKSETETTECTEKTLCLKKANS